MSNTHRNLALAAAVAAALAAATTGASAQGAADGKEKCYGISMAGKNDCASAGNNSCAGTSKTDYEKKAWKFVDKGTCGKMEVMMKDGTKRMGSPQPL